MSYVAGTKKKVRFLSKQTDALYDFAKKKDAEAYERAKRLKRIPETQEYALPDKGKFDEIITDARIAANSVRVVTVPDRRMLEDIVASIKQSGELRADHKPALKALCQKYSFPITFTELPGEELVRLEAFVADASTIREKVEIGKEVDVTAAPHEELVLFDEDGADLLRIREVEKGTRGGQEKILYGVVGILAEIEDVFPYIKATSSSLAGCGERRGAFADIAIAALTLFLKPEYRRYNKQELKEKLFSPEALDNLRSIYSTVIHEGLECRREALAGTIRRRRSKKAA